MKSAKTTSAKKTEKLALAKETVRSLHVRSDVRTGIFLGNGAPSSLHSSIQPTTQQQKCH